MTEAPDRATMAKRLQREACKMLNLDPDKLSGIEQMHVSVMGVLMLQVDDLEGLALAGKTIDAGRLSDLVKLLKQLLPQATVIEPSHEAAFAGAFETIATVIDMQVNAIEQREVHMTQVLQDQIAALEAENFELRAAIRDGVPLIEQPPQPPKEQFSPQPPLPPPSDRPPAAYLAPSPDAEPWKRRDRWSPMPEW